MINDYINKILSAIKEANLLDNDKFSFLQKKLKEESSNIDELVKKYSFMGQEEYAKIKSGVIGMPYKDLIDNNLDKEALKILPMNLASNYKMIIFNRIDDILEVGLVDPENFNAIEAVEFLAHKNNCSVKYYLISENAFNNAYKKAQNIEEEVGEALDYAKDKFEDLETSDEDEDLEEIIKTAPVTKIVSVLLKHAVDGRASDIHIEPVGKNSVIRFRIDGVLHKSIILPIYIHNALIARVKVMSNMKIDETRIPQDGRIRVNVKSQGEEKKIDLRVSTLPLLDYEKVVMRILSTPEKIPTFEDLGFMGAAKLKMEKAITKPNGMLLVTGPTGSGKSFTLFTVLNKINREGVNISTLEDPIEYNVEGVNQSQIRPEVDFTFATGLRSLLRQDPDIIMVGEIRDNETAGLAIHAALTGHLVLSTLHTNNAIGAIPRLIDMKVESFLLSSTLNLVLSQRLVRNICDNCKEEIVLPESLRKEMDQIIANLPESAFYGTFKKGDKAKFYHGMGCSRCGGTGYKGRSAMIEAFEMDNNLKDVINQRADMIKFEAELKKQGYISIAQDGIIKALNGLTTLEEVLSITKER